MIVHEPAFARHVPGAAVIPHGLEAGGGSARSLARARLGLDGRFTALCFGFVAPYKGLETALEASWLAGEGVELVVAGGDHPRVGRGYAEELRSRFPGAARFMGYVPERDLAAWFSGVDVALYLYPQPFAASGALALALAYGTPLLLSAPLAATMGAAEELVAPSEPGALAQRLRKLAGDPSRLESLRGQAAVLASERSWGTAVQATVRALTGMRGGFVVTPKQGEGGRQPRVVVPAVVTVGVLIAVAAYGLARDRSPSTLNNIAFAALHVSVLMAGAWPALVGARRGALQRRPERSRAAAAASARRAA